MILVVAGGYGCGTTHAYRIAIRALQLADCNPAFFGVSQAIWPTVDLKPGWTVIKTHDALVEPDPLTRIVLCRRSLFDAAASVLRRRPESEMLKGLGQRARLEKAYRDRDDVLDISYEALHNDPLGKIRLIAKHAGLRLSDSELQRVHALTGVEATRAEPDTLERASPTELRPEHIGPLGGAPGAGEQLSRTLKERIEAAYAQS